LNEQDRATVAFVNRNLTVPQFTTMIVSGVLTITTQKVILTYQVGQPFTSSSLTVKSNDASSAFKSWSYGQPNTGNLLGTIKSLDELGVVSLNCTENAHVRIIINHAFYHGHVLSSRFLLIGGYSFECTTNCYIVNGV
jgi:hypothetical protein